MDSGGEDFGPMAETLIVLTGENAWSAARGFGSQAARDGNLTGAWYWRSVARAVLRKYAALLVGSAEESATPSTLPAAPEAPAEMHAAYAAATAALEAPAERQEVPTTMPEIATADSASAGGWKNLGRAPIPLRARRQFTQPVPADAEAQANGAQAESTAAEFAIAKAA